MTHFFMLDTSTVSHVMKGKSKLARQKLASLRENQIVCISVVTEAELRCGTNAAQSQQNGATNCCYCNSNDFSHISDLERVVNWATDL